MAGPINLRRRRLVAERPPSPSPGHGHGHGGGGKWMMLDRAAVWGMEVNGSEASDTGQGHDVYVSLSLAKPPAASYFHVETPDAPEPTKEENGFYGHSSAVAAHRNRLLLAVPVVKGGDLRYTYPEDYFVYTAHTDRSPSLRRLPALDDHLSGGGEPPGIVCRGQESDEEYVVAVLLTSVIPSSSTEVAKLARFFSSKEDNKWEVSTQLTMPDYEYRRKKRRQFQWVSDAVFSIDGAVCWVNYTCGLLFCDVFEEDTPVLRFVDLPLHQGTSVDLTLLPDLTLEDLTLDDIEGCAHFHAHHGQIQSYRTVGVSMGKVRFVDVGPSQDNNTVSITTWTLQTHSEWHKDSVIHVADLWVNAFKDSDLPFVVPELPTLHFVDPDIVYFILKGHDSQHQVWVISINMSTKTMVICNRYDENRQGDDDDDDDTLCYNKIFLCSDLPAYL